MDHKLDNKTLFGYSSAAIADACLYNFVFMYFMYFLTDVAFVAPVFAGTIILVATLCDIVITPVVSQLSDNSRSRHGRRRPFILVAAIPIFIAMLLMFSVFDMSDGVKNAYYMIITIVFWIAFGVFVVPYYALAPELTPDQNERTKLRIPFVISNSMGNLLGMAAPMAIIAYFMAGGASSESAWFSLVIIIGGISALTLILTFFTTKGKGINPSSEQISERKKENVFVSYGRMAALKPAKYLLAITAIYMIAYGFILSAMTYFVFYKVEGPEEDISLASLVMIIACIVFTPIICGLAMRLDRNRVLGFSMILSAVGMLLFRAIGIETTPMMIVYLIVFVIANAAYWGLVQAMIYDLAEVYEYKYGERMEGTVVGINIIFIKVFIAIAMQFLGVLLGAGGYDPEATVQSAEAIGMIENAFVTFPAILIIVAAICALMNPINKERYDKLLVALDAKRKGEPHSIEGLEKIL